MLDTAMRLVLPAWDFAYNTCAVWDKVIGGTGYWLIDDSELLLIATRGKGVAPAKGTQFRSVIRHPRHPRAHSKKPAAAAEMIERYFPTTPKLEMFARGPARPGWDAWGNEAGA